MSQDILDSPWCNNLCRAYQELGRGGIYSCELLYSRQLSYPYFQVTYNLPTKKSNLKNNHAYLTDSHYSTFLLKKHQKQLLGDVQQKRCS